MARRTRSTRSKAPSRRAASRTVTFGVACSLDNFIARPDHSVDWLKWTKDVSAITSQYWKTIDTVVMGRKSYDIARNASGEAYRGVKCYVFSRTLPPARHGSTEILADDPAGFVRQLKSQPGKCICVMGGGELARELFEADLIDEVGLNIQPVLLGSGIPLFHALPRQIDLELIECREISGGCVYVMYRVKRGKLE